MAHRWTILTTIVGVAVLMTGCNTTTHSDTRKTGATASSGNAVRFEHVAFMVDAVRRKLIAAGATPVGEVTTTPAGDKLAMLRDPWGLAIQFLRRADPMLPVD